MVRAARVYQEQVQEGTTNSRGYGNPVSGSIEKKTSATLLRYPLNDYHLLVIHMPAQSSLMPAHAGVMERYDCPALLVPFSTILFMAQHPFINTSVLI